MYRMIDTARRTVRGRLVCRNYEEGGGRPTHCCDGSLTFCSSTNGRVGVAMGGWSNRLMMQLACLALLSLVVRPVAASVLASLVGDNVDDW